MKTTIMKIRLLQTMRNVKCCGIIIALYAASASLPAVTYTWTGAGFFGDQDFLWSNDFNWLGNAAPSPGESGATLIFPNTAAPRNTTNDIVGLTVSSIQFQGANYVINGKPSTNALILAGGGFVGFGVTATADDCQIAGSCPLVLSNAGLINVSGANTLSIRGRMSGPGGFSKSGTGTLELAAGLANTYAGTTSVSDGYLELNNYTFFPVPAGLVSIPGALMIGGTNQNVFPIVRLLSDKQIGDSSAVTVNDNGQLWLTGNDDMIGALTLAGGVVDTSGGTLTLNGNVTAIAPVLGGTAGQISGHLDLGSLSRTFTTEQSNAVLQITAAISGGNISHGFAGITKAGPGLLSLQGTNSYGGNTYVNGGILLAKTAGAFGATNLGSVTVSSNAMLTLDGVVNGPVVSGKSLTLHGGATLKASLDSSWNGSMQLAGQATIDVPGVGTTLTIQGIVSGAGGFTKIGTGELLFTGLATNTFTGMTWVRDGLLTLDRHDTPFPYEGRTVIPGALVIGTNIAMPPGLVAPPQVTLLSDDQIGDSSSVIVQANGVLHLDQGYDSIGALAVNSGQVETWGAILKIAGNLTCTNLFGEAGVISGSIGFTDGPHSIFVNPNDVGLDIPAALYWGSSNVTKLGEGILKLGGYSVGFAAPLVVAEGSLIVTHHAALGIPTIPTIVSNGASLWLVGDFETEEKLKLNGRDISGGPSAAALYSIGTNKCSGMIELKSDTAIHVSANSKLTLAARLNGVGGWRKVGPGLLVMAGSDGPSTYAGTTWVDQGKLVLQRSLGNNTYCAIPGQLEIATGPALGLVEVHAIRNFQFGAAGPAVIGAAGRLYFDTVTNSIGPFTGSGVVTIAPDARVVTYSLEEGLWSFGGTLQGGAPGKSI